jgi:hypothetical protein
MLLAGKLMELETMMLNKNTRFREANIAYFLLYLGSRFINTNKKA